MNIPLLEVVELGSVVVIVGFFVWYLREKNGRQERSMDKVTTALEKLHEAQDKSNQALIRLVDNKESKDKLMQ